MIEPKTWADEEIIDLMVDEATKTRADARERRHTLTLYELMENVLAVLEDKGLIEHTP